MSILTIDQAVDDSSILDNLTEEQIDKLYTNGSVEIAEPVVEPVVEPPIKEPESPQGVVSKNGEHLIPYAVLESEREKVRQLTAHVESQNTILKGLVDKVNPSNPANTADPAKESASLVTVFPEVAEDLKPLIEKMINDAIKPVGSELDVVKSAVSDQLKAHNRQLILDAHSDAGAVLNSKAFDDWMNDQKMIVSQDRNRPLPIYETLQNGMVMDVIHIISEFKKATAPTPSKADPKSDIEPPIPATVNKPPVSFNDLPGAGVADPGDPLDRIRNMDSRELEGVLAGLTPDKQNELLARLLG